MLSTFVLKEGRNGNQNNLSSVSDSSNNQCLLGEVGFFLSLKVARNKMMMTQNHLS